LKVLRSLALLCALCLALPAWAVNLMEGRLAIDGFGGWAYGITKDNSYLAGAPQGDYRHAYFSLNLSARVTDDFSASAQLFFPVGGEEGPSLDYAFAEWRALDWLRVRAGQIKQPFGLSNEVFDVGTLRPFYDLPQAIYGPVGFAGEAFTGAAITGSRGFGAWALSYDLYGGGLHLERFTAPENFLLAKTGEEDEEEIHRDLIGARLMVETPLEGLRFGVSGYRAFEVAETWREVIALSAEYATEALSIRAEAAHQALEGELTDDAAYVEVSYRFGPHWQVALLGDASQVSLSEAPDPVAPSFNQHLEGAVGLNYWVNPGLVFKLAVHHVEGNLLASPEPEEFADLVANDELVTSTNLFQAGVQFSF
jgi:hypothetical protein